MSHRQVLRRLLRSRCIDESGIDLQRGLLYGEALALASNIVLAEIKSLPRSAPRTQAVAGGVEAVPLLAGIVMRAAQWQMAPMEACAIRAQAKGHGSKERIDNEPAVCSDIVLVAGIMTESVTIYVEALTERGHRCVGVVALIQAARDFAVISPDSAPIRSVYWIDDLL